MVDFVKAFEKVAHFFIIFGIYFFTLCWLALRCSFLSCLFSTWGRFSIGNKRECQRDSTLNLKKRRECNGFLFLPFSVQSWNGCSFCTLVVVFFWDGRRFSTFHHSTPYENDKYSEFYYSKYYCLYFHHEKNATDTITTNITHSTSTTNITIIIILKMNIMLRMRMWNTNATIKNTTTRVQKEHPFQLWTEKGRKRNPLHSLLFFRLSVESLWHSLLFPIENLPQVENKQDKNEQRSANQQSVKK